MQDIKLPLIGEVSKKEALIGGGALAVILGIAYFRHRSAANAASSADTTTSPDTSGLDSGYSQDYPASDYGGAYYPPSGTGNIIGTDQYGDPIYGVGGGSTTGSTGTTYSTNESWASAAENDLAAMNVSQSAAATAISRILGGLSVTKQQEDLFMEAVGLIGPPPGGYPQPIKLTDTAQHPGASKVSVPNVVGRDVEQASNTLHSAGLKVIGPKGVPGILHIVTAESPKAGTMVSAGSTVTLSYKSEKESVR